MSLIKTEKEIGILREGGKRHAEILARVALETKAGVSTQALNELAHKLVVEAGDEPAFLNYTPNGAERPFPASICISVNDEIVHGIPTENPKVLEEGDIVTLDLGLKHKGMFTDAAITVAVGAIDQEAAELLALTKKALDAGIKEAKAGNHVGDIGYAIERLVGKSGFSIADDLAGHGVGNAIHEDPYVPNFGKRGKGELLQAGMVIAIEPIVNEGDSRILLEDDDYTYRTIDGKRSAHFEHTVLITAHGPEILTQAK